MGVREFLRVYIDSLFLIVWLIPFDDHLAHMYGEKSTEMILQGHRSFANDVKGCMWNVPSWKDLIHTKPACMLLASWAAKGVVEMCSIAGRAQCSWCSRIRPGFQVLLHLQFAGTQADHVSNTSHSDRHGVQKVHGHSTCEGVKKIMGAVHVMGSNRLWAQYMWWSQKVHGWSTRERVKGIMWVTPPTENVMGPKRGQ